MKPLFDGGPAYPSPDSQHAHALASAVLEQAGGESLSTAQRDRIYTEARAECLAGMSKRDDFAKAAMLAILTNEALRAALAGDVREEVGGYATVREGVAQYAYAIADAMLAERAKVRAPL